jgi:LacI family transcriptional regulator
MKATSSESVRVIVAVEVVAGYQRQIIRGITSFAHRYRPQWELLFDHRVQRPRVDRFEQFRDVGACIIHPAGDASFVERVRDFPGPVVAAGDVIRGLPSVTPDEGAVGALAFDHLRSKGFTRLGFFGPVEPVGPGESRWQLNGVFQDRYAGFAGRAKRQGLDPVLLPPKGLLESIFETVEPRTLLIDWLRDVPKPLGLFCANIMLGREAVSACRVSDVGVPEDVAVLGVDHDDLLCGVVQPALSTIDHGMVRVGFEAAALLDRILTGKIKTPRDTRVVIPPLGVEQRQSTDTLAVEDEDVREAVRLIRAEALDGLRAQDVVAAATVSRRTLEPKFHRIIGRSIKQEIQRQRIEHAKTLLASGEMKLPEIAAHCGFSYASRLTQAFKGVTGVCPSEYRRAARIS